MERKKVKGTILWKKLGGGPFHANIDGKVRIIKPGQEFHAREDEIPAAFRDMVVPVNPLGGRFTVKEAEEHEKEEAEKAQPVYELRHRGAGWWNVVNEDGKVQNEKALKKPDAEALLESLLK